MSSPTKVLLEHLDTLIDKYESSNPQISKELRDFRVMLRDHMRRGDAVQTAATLLRISSWVKWIIDHLSDG